MSIVVFVKNPSTVIINVFIFCLTNQDAEQIYIQLVKSVPF